MALPLPTGRTGRAYAAGILFALIALYWFIIVSPLLDLYRDRQEQLDQRRAVAIRMAQRASELSDLRDRVARVTRAGARPSSLLQGDTDPIAAANLQDMVQRMASTAGAQVSSTESLPAQTEDSYRRIGIRISMRASHGVLTALLSAIDRASLSMLVDDIQIRGSPLPIPNAPDVLDVSFSVYAFRRGDQGPSAT
jgi:general secretion pathway protein M